MHLSGTKKDGSISIRTMRPLPLHFVPSQRQSTFRLISIPSVHCAFLCDSGLFDCGAETDDFCSFPLEKLAGGLGRQTETSVR